MAREPSPERYSPGKTQEARAQAVRDIVSTSADLMRKAPIRTSLHDAEAVRRVAESMMDRCSTTGLLPTVELLAACLGHSRRGLYKWLSDNPNSPTAEYLDQLRTAFSACRIAAADRGAADSSVSIFLLLNSNEGYTNEHRLEISQPQSPLEIGQEEIEKARQRFLSALPDIEDE